MTKPYLIKFILTFLFVSLAVNNLFAQATASGWTSSDEKDLYDVLYDSSKQMLKEDAQRKEWANCAVQKLKTTLPKGINSVSQDSVSKLANQIGSSCVLSLQNPVYVWSPVMTTTLRQQVMANAAMQKYTEARKKELADCMLVKFQKLYPDGFTSEQMKTLVAKLINDCVDEITVKKP